MAEGPAYYDAAIAVEGEDGASVSPHLYDVAESPYRALFETVAAMITSRPPTHVIDLGCGTGRFASLVLPHTGASLSYLGYDFSTGMLEHARAFNADHVTGIATDDSDVTGTVAFEHVDLRDDDMWQPWTPTTIVCLETLEHLDSDLRLLARLPVDARLIISVPSFDSAAHVRHFPEPGDALDRYGDVLDLETWKRVWLPARTGYFHLMTGKVRP